MSEKIKVSQLRESTNGTDSDLVMIVQENEENELENFKQTKQEFLSDTRALIDNKQNKEVGKGLSTNDFTTPLKAKLEGIEAGAEANKIDEIDINGIAQVPVNKKIDISVPEKTSDLENDSEFVSRNTTGLLNYTLTTQTGSKIDLELNTSTYVLTAKLYDKNNNLISTSSNIDLPLETMVVGASYDSTTKEIVLTLKNGQTIRFSVADLVSGLQSEITPSNKLNADLVDDSTSTNKFVTTQDKTNWNAKVDEEDIADFVKNTDYPTSTKGGVVVNNTSYGVSVNSNGVIYALSRDYNQYQNAPINYAVSKGTLENVITGKQLINQTQLQESQQPQNDRLEDLEEIVSNIPPKTGTGEEFTIDNTMKCKHVSDELGGNTDQETTNGYQLLPYPYVDTTKTHNGITYTDNGDGTITINGTATANSSFALQGTQGSQIEIAGNYIGGGINSNVRVRTMNKTETYTVLGSSEGSLVAIDKSTYSTGYIEISIVNGTTVNNQVIKPLLTNNSSATYEKYTGRNSFT